MILVFIAIAACSTPVDQELLRSGKVGAAQGRISASQSGADSVFKDFD